MKVMKLKTEYSSFSYLHLSREILCKQSSYSWISLGFFFMLFMVTNSYSLSFVIHKYKGGDILHPLNVCV